MAQKIHEYGCMLAMSTVPGSTIEKRSVTETGRVNDALLAGSAEVTGDVDFDAIAKDVTKTLVTEVRRRILIAG
jgi:hypothetical protein